MWVFFTKPIHCSLARNFGLALAPDNAPLVGGDSFASPRTSHGIEIFPKQTVIDEESFGNYVWLPFANGKKDGANKFFEIVDGDSLREFSPKEFLTADEEAVKKIVIDLGFERDHEKRHRSSRTKGKPFRTLLQCNEPAVSTGCNFIRFCEAESASLPEAPWYALAGVYAFIPGGREKFHKLSEDYAGYSFGEADEKFERAAEMDGPRTCDDISQRWDGCPQCPHYQKLSTPVQIGNIFSANEIAETAVVLLDTDAGAPYSDQVLEALSLLRRLDNVSYARITAKLKKKGVKLKDLESAMALFLSRRGRSNGDSWTGGRYSVENGCIVMKRKSGEVEHSVPLCNFDAEIVSEITTDDGQEQRKVFCVKGCSEVGRLPDIDISASEFLAMNWPMEKWGIGAIVNVGQGIRDHLRVAIMNKSKHADRINIYTHLVS